jgi:uncharacterized protein (TIGR00369 family)
MNTEAVALPEAATRAATPTTVAASPTSVDGLALLQAMVRGELPAPPIAELLGMGIAVVEPGRVVFTLDTRPEFANPLGTVHGGIASTLIDSATGCAIHTALPAGSTYTTVDLSVTFVRPIELDGAHLRCEGTALHVGRKVATARARITDDRHRLVAHGSSTCVVLPESR